MADGLPLNDLVLQSLNSGILDDSSSDSTSSDSDSTSSSSSGSEDGYRFHDRRLLREMPTMSDRKFKRMFGMCRPTFGALVDDIFDELPIGSSTNGMSMHPDERLATFLYSMRSNSFNFFAADALCEGEGTVTRNTSIVITGLNPRVPGVHGDRPSFVQRHIYIPCREKALEDARNFGTLTGFPEIVWSIVDGTHIQVSSTLKFLSSLILEAV